MPRGVLVEWRRVECRNGGFVAGLCGVRLPATSAAQVGDLSLALVGVAFLAGGVACSVSHALAVPIDVIKTRKQLPQYSGTGTLQVTRSVLQDEPRALLGGLGATFWGYFAQGCLKYGLFYVLKSELLTVDVGAPKVVLLLMAGVMAETVWPLAVCEVDIGLSPPIVLQPPPFTSHKW